MDKINFTEGLSLNLLSQFNQNVDKIDESEIRFSKDKTFLAINRNRLWTMENKKW